MYYRIDQIKLKVEEKQNILPSKIAKMLGITEDKIIEWTIKRESIDARKKNSIIKVYSVDVKVQNGVSMKKGFKAVLSETYVPPVKGEKTLINRPIIVGFGPAGMMAAYLLAREGYRPVVLEQGNTVDERSKQVDLFWEKGVLDPQSNVQFGEGGAGTFSDGKLTCRTRDVRSQWFFEKLVEAGAPAEILYQAKPHVGTDVLKAVVKNIREKILLMGGEINFKQEVSDLLINNGEITGVKTRTGERFESNVVILAVGHSARNVFNILHKYKIPIAAKPFAVGFRIEHEQDMINRAQFGDIKNVNFLGPADYHLTHQSNGGRAVYTFCMCPGGYVVGAASEPEHLVVNGMSYHARDGQNANSALLVSVNEKDFESGALGGVILQRQIESAAYKLANNTYNAPVQTVKDFLKGKKSSGFGTVVGTHKPGHTFEKISDVLPEQLTEALKEGIVAMGKRIKGFDSDDAVLTAVETRSSSPVRILRSAETYESIGIVGMYPSGEGAGYAGGIVSSAVDGIKTAEAVINKHKLSKGY